MKKLSLVFLSIVMYTACSKHEPVRNDSSTVDLIAEANQYFIQSKIASLPNNPQNPRTQSLKTPDWSAAYIAEMKIGRVVLVPVRYVKPLYVRYSFAGDRVFCLDNLTKLLIYKDSLGIFHNELVTAFPDSVFVAGHSKSFKGLVFVDDFQGYPLHKYKFEADGIVTFSTQETNVSNAKKIVENDIIEICNVIGGYNYSPSLPNEGYAWSEEICTINVVQLSQEVPSNELLDNFGGSANIVWPTYITTNYSLNIGNSPIGNIQQYLGCFTNIAGNSNTYTVTLCVDQPKPETRTPWVFQNTVYSSSAAGTPVDVGHTFLIFTQAAGSNVVQRNMGLYPNGTVTPSAPLARGMLNDDETHQYNISLSVTVTNSQFFQMLSAAAQPGVFWPPYQYDLNSNNCSAFALNVFAAAGINLPRTTGTWPGGGGCNPGDLGEDIRAMPLTSNESLNTTQTTHPNIGTCQ